MSILKPAVSAQDHILGSLQAKIILVEYGDYQCPHCRNAHPLLKKLLASKGEEVGFVFRNFPIQSSHPMALPAALAAEAAEKQGKFWEMHDLIYENQQKLHPDFLLELAESLKLDTLAFQKDMQDPVLSDRIENDIESGARSGVNGTPSFFVNGHKFHYYDGTYSSLEQALKESKSL